MSRYNEVYTWTNPTCCVHNIIVGQLWIEQYGNVEVVNHRWAKNKRHQNLKQTLRAELTGWRRYAMTPLPVLFYFLLRTGERCFLNFKPCGLFGRELHKVEGYILDKR